MMEKTVPERVDETAEKMGSVATLPVAYELELHRMIELAAYYRAEQDGFRYSPLDYWLAAERDIRTFF